MQYDNVFIIVKQESFVGNCDNEGKYSYWKDTFFKLVAVCLIQFEKIVLIDSDMLVNRNIDNLFDRTNMSGVMAWLCERPTWKNLNSGLLVIEPNVDMYNPLIDCIEPAINRKDLLNLYVVD